jgi:hypothetical protein
VLIPIAAKQNIFHKISQTNASKPSTILQPRVAILFQSLPMEMDLPAFLHLHHHHHATALPTDLVILQFASTEFAHTSQKLVTMELLAPPILVMQTLESAATLSSLDVSALTRLAVKLKLKLKIFSRSARSWFTVQPQSLASQSQSLTPNSALARRLALLTDHVMLQPAFPPTLDLLANTPQPLAMMESLAPLTLATLPLESAPISSLLDAFAIVMLAVLLLPMLNNSTATARLPSTTLSPNNAML